MPVMEVIGEDGLVYPVEVPEYYGYGPVAGDVMGDVMGVGYAGPMGDWEGQADVDGAYQYPAIVGARRRGHHVRGAHNVRVHQPGWRRGQLAPGVIAPDQGLLPLPLKGNPSNTFDLNTISITFEGQVQKPFRPERLNVTVVRTGTSATGLLLGKIFNGTDLQQLNTPDMDIEALGNPNAFGFRLTMKPVQPGVDITIPITLSSALTTTDTILVSMFLLGRNVH